MLLFHGEKCRNEVLFCSSQLLNTTLPNGGQVTYTYYDNGLLHTQTDANGNVTEYTYDSAGRISMVTQGRLKNTYAYDAYGNLASVTNAMGETISYTYNELRQVVKVTDARGNSTFYEYDTLGNCTQMTDALSHVTKYEYNGANEIVSATKIGENGNKSQTIHYEYDNLGNIITITDAAGNVYKMKYDLVGNLLQIDDAMGNTIQSYTYDSMNQVTSVTNAAGSKTEYEYDSLGNLIKQMNQDTGAVTTYQYVGGRLMNAATDALGGQTSATYNSMGDMVSFTNPNGGVTTYTYDLNQNKLSESIGQDYKITYTYNDLNQMASKVNSRGQKTVYEYDNAGRIISLTDELGTIAYSYDKNGNVTAVTDENGTITREYDALNWVTSYKDVKGNTICYSYDEFGNLSQMVYPNGEVVNYEYDLNNNLTGVADNDGKKTSYSYDANGRLVKTVRPNGTEETRTYDKAGQLTSILNKKGETVISEYQYSYDLSGNITQVTTGKSSNSQSQTSITNANMEYDQNNRLVKYNGQTVTYDKDGNMTYGPLNGEMTTFVYDCRNRLIQAGNTKYEYDAENHRTTVIKNAGTTSESRTEFIVDSVQELSQILQSTTYQNGKVVEEQTYLYGNGLISQHSKESGSELYYHFNNVGSTTAVTDNNGNVKYSYEYSPYGELIKGTYGQVMFLYNGQYGVASDDNGLYYMRARYYNIAIKRFCNQDVLTGEIGESQSLNRYAYVEGNPVNYLDPFGLSVFDTSELHNNIAWVSAGLSATALLIALFAPALTLALATAVYGGILLTSVNAVAYGYDLAHAETYEEKMNAKLGLAGAGIGISLSFIPGSYFIKGISDDLLGAIIDFAWNISSYIAGEVNNALNR